MRVTANKNPKHQTLSKCMNAMFGVQCSALKKIRIGVFPLCDFISYFCWPFIVRYGSIFKKNHFGKKQQNKNGQSLIASKR